MTSKHACIQQEANSVTDQFPQHVIRMPLLLPWLCTAWPDPWPSCPNGTWPAEAVLGYTPSLIWLLLWMSHALCLQAKLLVLQLS